MFLKQRVPSPFLVFARPLHAMAPGICDGRSGWTRYTEFVRVLETSMPHHEFFWLDDTIRKLADNDLTIADVEFAVRNAFDARISATSGRPAYVGPTGDARTIFVVYEPLDATQILVITAFEIGRVDS